MHPMLNIAVKAARRAGSVISRASLDPGALEVRAKHANDFVTQVDRAAEQAAIDIIRRAYPDHGILAEESGAVPGEGGKAEYLWIIDPLDGTTNFIHGFPHYCVSIGVQHKGTMTQAVVFDPTRNELFTASRGRGAFLNDRRIRVTKCLGLANALLGTGFPPKERPRLDTFLAQLKIVMTSSQGMRRAGSAALDLAYVAAGRLDGFWEMGLSKWDIAAGSLLVVEAGGLVGDFQGETTYMDSGDIVAATPKVFAQILEALR
jgi:myo-inositol-1(or 4)-monophosphatase